MQCISFPPTDKPSLHCGHSESVTEKLSWQVGADRPAAAADAAAGGGLALSTTAAPARTKPVGAKKKDSEEPGDNKGFGPCE